jgi:hypothetical protein
MFIDRKSTTTMRGSEGGMKLDRYWSSLVPPLRTVPEVAWPTSYKHVTPTGWNPRSFSSAIIRWASPFFSTDSGAGGRVSDSEVR